ncbi:MAG TPA: hypothetical protein DEF03_03005 [Bacteroidetes bacterium]|nr:hypothetical protein [Bacteroidota bacterium]
MGLASRTKILSIVLFVIVVALSYLLYRSLTDPYKAVIAEQEMTENVRHRMELVRDALVLYNSRVGDYPPTENGLTALVEWVKTDSLISAQAGSLFAFLPPDTFNADQLIVSPRTGASFTYTLNDTLRPNVYLLEDPDSEDQIGDLRRTTMLNAPNWN